MARVPLTIGLFAIAALLTCCEVPVPTESNVYEQSIQRKMRAEKCVISFDTTNSIGQHKQTIRIEVFNPHEEISASPFWYTSSVTALQYYWDTHGQDFTRHEYIEVKLTQSGEHTLNDSTQSHAEGHSVRDVILADSLYTITLAVLQDPDGSGFTKCHSFFDRTFTNQRLQLCDSTRRMNDKKPVRGQSCVPGGFQYLHANGDTLAFVYVIEECARGTEQHRFVFSKESLKILDYTVALL
jgi:hypothetical protein